MYKYISKENAFLNVHLTMFHKFSYTFIKYQKIYKISTHKIIILYNKRIRL